MCDMHIIMSEYIFDLNGAIASVELASFRIESDSIESLSVDYVMCLRSCCYHLRVSSTFARLFDAQHVDCTFIEYDHHHGAARHGQHWPASAKPFETAARLDGLNL